MIYILAHDNDIYMYSRLGQAIIVPALSYPTASGYFLAQGPGSSNRQNRNRLLVTLTWLVVVEVVVVEEIVVVYVLVSMTCSAAEMSAPDRNRSAVILYCPVESAKNKQLDPFYKSACERYME